MKLLKYGKSLSRGKCDGSPQRSSKEGFFFEKAISFTTNQALNPYWAKCRQTQ